MLNPGDRATFRPDILQKFNRMADPPVFTILEVGSSPIDSARRVARVADVQGFGGVLSLGLLVKLDDSR